MLVFSITPGSAEHSVETSWRLRKGQGTHFKGTAQWHRVESSGRAPSKNLVSALVVCGIAASSKKKRRKQNVPRRSVIEEAAAVVEEATSTLEDAAMHVRRILPTISDGKPDELPIPPQERSGKPRIVVLGTGWASHALAKVIDTEANDVIVVSPRNYFIFTPMLAAASVGTVEYRSILEHIRSANPTLQFYQGSCEEIDVEQKIIKVLPTKGRDWTKERESFLVSYDTLVVAIGTKTSSMGIPGVQEHCFFLKQIQDARRIRRRVTECFELADLPETMEEEMKQLLTFVVVGGGPTGCEFCGELSDFVQNDLRRFYPKLAKYVRIVLVQRGKALLPMFGPELQAEAMRALESQGIEILTGAQVSEVTATSITIQTPTGLQQVPCGLCMWAAGNGPVDLVTKLQNIIPQQKALAEEVPRGRGAVLVDEWLRVIGVPDGSVLAMGDCSRVVGAGEALPQTAQVAAQQGAYVSRLINRGYQFHRDGPPRLPEGHSPIELLRARFQFEAPTFTFFDLGKLAYLGEKQAVAQVQLGDKEISQAAGRAAFWLWRSVYVVKQVSFRNRVLVLFDWVKSQIFGRDVTRF
mmetsp:Transcript_21762/g.49529  ORF Transcript_21762/g.49529 Transcript_21762/m.49529 type:complete len:582 (-) Transcript_21762:42-1787(-)